MSRQERETPVRTVPPESAGPVVDRPPGTTIVHERVVAEGPVTWEEMRALLRRQPMWYERTWRPTAGGILAILAGALNLGLGIGAVFGGNLLPNVFTSLTSSTSTTVGTAAGIFYIVIGIVAIVGGYFALARRLWPWVLAGSIAAVLPTPIILPFIMGVFALIFNTLGHLEMRGTNIEKATR